MRKVIVTSLLAAGGLIMLIAPPAEAARTRYPFCLQGATSPGLSNCTLTNLAQCQATASGRFLTCVANPFCKGRRRISGTHSLHLISPMVSAGAVRIKSILHPESKCNIAGNVLTADVI